MNDRTVTINVRAVVDDLLGGMKKAEAGVQGWAASTEAAVEKVEASTEKISHLWRSAFEAFLGFEAVKTLRDMAAAAAGAADELGVAARIAQNFSQSFNAAAMESWIEQFSKAAAGGGYAVDDMRKAVQEFVAVGLGAAQVQRAIADTAALAASRNMDFSQAMYIVQMALTGHVDMLTRYGVVSREAAKNIHTVEQAMQAIEGASSGAAEERASSLTGALGRLGSASQLLRDKIGEGLVPIFNEITDVLTRFANAATSIPKPILDAAVSVGTFVVGLVAVTLALPAVAKGIAIVKESFALILSLASPIKQFFTDLVLAAGRGEASLLAFGAAQLEAAAPVVAVVAAIAGIIVAIVELVNHLDHVKSAWHDWTQYLSDSFAEFVENFKKDHDVLLQLIEGVAGAVANPASAAETLAQTSLLVAPKSAIKDGPKLTHDTNQIGADIVSDWTKIFARVKSLFSGALPKVTVPDPGIPGVIPGQKNPSGQKGVNDAIDSAKQVIDAAAAAATQAVDQAKAKLDLAKSELEAFKAQKEGQELSPADVAKEQALITSEMRAQQSVKTALVAQEQAEQTAAERYAALAKALPETDKQRVQHMGELNKAAQEHLLKVTNIKAAIYDIIGALAGMTKAWKDAPVEPAEKRAKSATQGIQSNYADTQGTLKSQAYDVAFQQKIGQLTGATPDAMNQLAIQAAQLAQEMAQNTVDEIQRELALDRSAESQETRDSQLASLHKNLSSAEDALQKATDDYKTTVIEANKAHTAWLQSLVSHVPGVGVNYDKKTGQFSGLSVNPMEILLEAIEKSKAFADIMTVVNAIMSVFSQIIDALRPVIDALLEVVIGVVKVFIGLWNAIAHILALLGIHIQFLELQNQNEQTQAPLLAIYHDLPTLKEANSQAPLTLTAIEDSYTNSITNPLENALKDTSLGGGLFSVLGEILGVLVAIKVIMGLMGAGTGGGWLGGIAQSILKLFGVGGGGAGGLPGWLGGGAGVGAGDPAGGGWDWGALFPTGDAAMSAPSLSDALAAINNLPDQAGMTTAVQNGVTNAFAHGTTMTFSTIAAAISGAFEGFALGQLTSKMFGTDSPAWGEALGSAGGIVGGLLGAHLFAGLGAAAGPVGALAGAVLGALIGGMIGPHWGPASNYPDRSDTQGYGTFVTDMNGVPGSFNGQRINPQGPYNVAAGGTPIAQMLDAWLKDANLKDLSSSQAAIFAQLQSLGGSNGQLGIKSEYNGVFTLLSGQQIAVSAYEQLVQKFLNAVQDPLNSLGESLIQQAQNVQRATDRFNELSGALDKANASYQHRTSVQSGAAQPMVQHTGDINIQHTGDINGYGDLESFMTDAALACERGFANRKYLISGAPQS